MRIFLVSSLTERTSCSYRHLLLSPRPSLSYERWKVRRVSLGNELAELWPVALALARADFSPDSECRMG